jgi:hypothetical protein
MEWYIDVIVSTSASTLHSMLPSLRPIEKVEFSENRRQEDNQTGEVWSKIRLPPFQVIRARKAPTAA